MGSMDKLLRKTYKELKAKGKERKKNERFLRKWAANNPMIEDFEEELLSDKQRELKRINEKVNSNYEGKYAKKPKKSKEVKYDYEDDIPF